MMEDKIELVPLQNDDLEQFVSDNQEAFNYGAMKEFGLRDAHMEEDDQIISRDTILRAISEGEAYRIVKNHRKTGGAVIKTEGNKGYLSLLFVAPDSHSSGIGYAAWCAIEKLHPEVKIWQTETPYFEKRNIHFYVNRCGFQIIEFYNEHHINPNEPLDISDRASDEQCADEMFLFEKRIN